MIYHEILKYQAGGTGKTSCVVCDDNVCNITYDTWEKMVNDRIKRVAFVSLTEMCSTNKKTCLLSHSKFMRAPYFSKFNPSLYGVF